METNLEYIKVMKIKRQPSPVHTMIDQKQPKNVEYDNYLSNLITSHARCTVEIISKTVMAKSSNQQKKGSFHLQIRLTLKGKK